MEWDLDIILETTGGFSQKNDVKDPNVISKTLRAFSQKDRAFKKESMPEKSLSQGRTLGVLPFGPWVTHQLLAWAVRTLLIL